MKNTARFDFYKTAKQLLSSKLCLLIILGLAAVQGLWYAVNFYPTILDEGRHFGFIQLYTEQLSPFISQQESRWDYLGEVTREPSYLYYYIMSFPLRLAKLFTQNMAYQIIFLRLINIALFAAAIYVYDKLFKAMKVSTAVSRIVLLFLILTPALSILPGVISYDNAVFLLSALLLLAGVRTITAKRLNPRDVPYLATISLFGISMKFSFTVIVIPVFAYVFIHLIRTNKLKDLRVKQFFGVKSFTRINVVLASLIILGVFLVVERIGTNVIRYRSFAPSCAKIISEDRCLKNYTQQRSIKARVEKPVSFAPKSVYEYAVVDWLPGMVRTQVRLVPWEAPVLSMFLMYSVAFFGGIVLLLMYVRDFLKGEVFKFTLFVMIFYCLALFLENYSSYSKLGQVVAVSSRYLLPVIPLFMVLVALSASSILGRHKTLLLVAMVSCLLLFTQGGGVLTYRQSEEAKLHKGLGTVEN